MLDDNTSKHLADIETITYLMKLAPGEDDLGVRARQELIVLYYGAAYRYMLGALRDAEAAQELAQQFATKFMQGDFVKKADPEKGRFRDFLKRCLQNAVIDHQRKGGKGPQALPEDSAAYSPDDEETLHSDRAFIASLRDELISSTWRRLAQEQESGKAPYEIVLRRKTENPQLRSAQLAELLSAELNKTFTESGIRQLLRRARDKFAEFLLENVEQALRIDDLDMLEEQLVELKLLEFCRPALEGRRARK